MGANEKNINKFFIYWLCTSLILVYLAILIGGLTRLTNSGLSITEWELFKGIFPPLTSKSWSLYFEAYKKIPQYKLLNFNMSLEEFKIIFYWEYFHRILARIIGLFFLIPLIYFYITKKIKKFYLNTCLLIFFLIIFQGFMGWYMVKSGLVNDITVSHYRLSIHLSTAVLIISIMFWLIRNLLLNKQKIFFKFENNSIFFQILVLIIFIQIVLGAFVSGLDAGKIYQTWPLMDSNYFPNDLIIADIKSLANFDNHSLIQFYHRNLAYLIIVYSLLLSFYIYRKKIIFLYKPIKILLLVLSAQIILGIFTLISGLNIFLASAHQIFSVLLILSALNLYFYVTK